MVDKTENVEISGRALSSPITFAPILKELVWGGRKLAGLGKKLPPSKPYGESWEIVDLETDQSVITDARLSGQTIHDLVEENPADLLGPVKLDGGRFPLLVKYIDAAQTLSVQVHPDEAATKRMGFGRPKNEAWYILEAEPDAVLYLGLKPGTTRAQLESAIDDGKAVEQLLQPVPARPGDLIPVWPGTVHAIGAGILLAEVQQPSDTTYRVYDWGRVGLDGKPRQLHVAEALECIDFDRQVAIGASSLDAGHFKVRAELLLDQKVSLVGVGPRVVVGIDGTLQLSAIDSPIEITRGKAALVPHCVQESTITGNGMALIVSFPA